MRSNASATGAALLAVTSSVSIFHSMLPPFSEVRKATGQEGIANDVRAGEVASAALVVGLGITATALTDSPIPLVTSILSILILIAVYERALTATPKELSNVESRNNVYRIR